jgi:hypothetical protein
MAVSFALAIIFLIYNKTHAGSELSTTFQLLFGIGFTTLSWVFVSLVTNPTDKQVIEKFENKVFEVSLGETISNNSEGVLDNKSIKSNTVVSKFHNFGFKILGFIVATLGIYSALFATGYFLYGETALAWICTGISIAGSAVLIGFSKKIFS